MVPTIEILIERLNEAVIRYRHWKSNWTWRRVLVGYRVRHRLRGYARRNLLRARATGTVRFAGVLAHRLSGSSKKLTPAGGGGVIAFVGSEATGKSTIIEVVQGWLGESYTVRRIHAGKPPATALTYVPHSLLPALRALFPDQRSTRVEKQDPGVDRSGRPYPVMFGVRSVMLAYERRALLTQAFARSADGTIVLSDRYPSSRSGAPDGPQLAHRSASDGLRRWLAATETRLYDQIPAPDLVIHLTAPLEVTLARNAAREKTEPEDHVRFRHSLSSNLEFDGVPVHRIGTDRPIEEVMREVKEAIWKTL
jgi:thymidylate kinase